MRKIALLLIIGLSMALADTFGISENGKLIPLTTPTQAENEIINRCIKPSFSTPVDVKTLGIKGDGSDESAALQTLLNKGGSFLFKDITVVLNNAVKVTRSVNIKMVFENAKLEATVQQSPNQQRHFLYFEHIGGFLEIDGAELDGNEMVNEGIRVACSHEIHNCNIHHFSSNEQPDNHSAIGILAWGRAGEAMCSSIHDNYIHDIQSWDSGAVNNGTGSGANAIWIIGESSTREIHAYVERNTIDMCYGLEGCGVYIQDDDSALRNGVSSYLIDRNIMSNINRRMFKAYGSNITFTNNVMTTFPLGSPHIKYGASLLDIARGSINPIVSGNKIYSTGHISSMMNIDNVKDGHWFNNEIYHSGNTSGRIAQVGNADNVLVEDNIFQTSASNLFKFDIENQPGGMMIKNNTFNLVDGNEYFTKMFEYVDFDNIRHYTKEYITLENNIFDGSASGVAHATKFNTILLLDWNGIDLVSVELINNKVIGGVNNNTEGFIVREDHFSSDDKYTYTDVLFQGYEADGSEDIFRIYDTSGITFKEK